MHRLIPRPSRCVATGDSSPSGGRWLLTFADQRLQTVAQTARQLIAPDCPGLAPAARFEPADALPESGVSRIRLALGGPGEPPGPARVLGVDPAGQGGGDESYGLTTSAGGIECVARTPRGLLRAAASAAQLLGSSGQLAHLRVDDAPRYAWRGLMVDPARHFITPADLRRLVDLVALYKLNVLHLHLTDNQAWRIEVPGWPRLTESCEGRCYSLAEFADLQEYAAARHVTVVPEIDLPGHCAAAVRAYPQLGVMPASRSGPPGLAAMARPLDPLDPASRHFTADAFACIAGATAGPYVHIGGDESFGMSGEAFAGSVRHARACVRAAGRRPLGWQETARAGAGPDDIGQLWVDPQLGDLPRTQAELDERPELAAAGLTMELIGLLAGHFAAAGGDLARAVAAGGSVLLSPQSHLYLDRPYDLAQAPAADRDCLGRLGFRGYRPQDLRAAAAWRPEVPGLPADRVAGVEATLFGESLQSFGDLCTLLLPRLPGVAETAWSGPPGAWPGYRSRLGAHSALWRRRGLRYFAATSVAWA